LEKIKMDTNAHLEGDDVPAERLRIYLYGDGFASIDGEIPMSAFGPAALQTIAKKLLAVGHDRATARHSPRRGTP
jgi:hypothetical protein